MDGTYLKTWLACNLIGGSLRSNILQASGHGPNVICDEDLRP
jgi:hypothetical protein